MNSDCQNLKESSVYIKFWISQQPAVKEESLTDWLLFDVSRRIRAITYQAFTRHEEARQTGADWEWWFLFRELSVKMRVQAKKIDPTGDDYPSIAHTNKYGLQIDKLLKDSKEMNFLPFYAFYTHLQERVLCQKGVNDEGVFLAGSNQIYNDFIKSGRAEIAAPTILARSIPLSCFICCPICSEGQGSFGRFIGQYYPQEIGREEPSDVIEFDEIPGFYRQIPGYVSSFIEHAREGLPIEWELEYRRYLEGVNSMVVYDARQ